MGIGIEHFLGLSEEEIERRMSEERRKIPTEFLKERLKRFDTPEFKFINHLMHDNPKSLSHALDRYAIYSGNEARAAIIEGLKEKYILEKLLLKYHRKSIREKLLKTGAYLGHDGSVDLDFEG